MVDILVKYFAVVLAATTTQCSCYSFQCCHNSTQGKFIDRATRNGLQRHRWFVSRKLSIRTAAGGILECKISRVTRDRIWLSRKDRGERNVR